MKIILLTAAALWFTTGEWLNNFDEAQQQAKADHKTILLLDVFGAEDLIERQAYQPLTFLKVIASCVWI